MKSDYAEYKITEDPIQTFESWYKEAQLKEINCDAFTLSTISLDGGANARTLLFKGIKESAFSFYTNFNSVKGREISANPNIALTFFWPLLGQQVRVRGIAKKMKFEDSKNYFQSRSHHSQVASYVSKQSEPLESREKLVTKYQEILEQFSDGELPYPENWGGYLVVPSEITFFIYGEHRLNDRFKFYKEGDQWRIERLYP